MTEISMAGGLGLPAAGERVGTIMKWAPAGRLMIGAAVVEIAGLVGCLWLRHDFQWVLAHGVHSETSVTIKTVYLLAWAALWLGTAAEGAAVVVASHQWLRVRRH